MIQNVEEFVEELLKRTKSNEVSWKKVSPSRYKSLVERNIAHAKVVDAYYQQRRDSNDIVVIGRLERRIYTDVDEYYLQDEYFFTETDTSYLDPVNHFDGDENINDFQFGIKLARLYRLIKLSGRNPDDKFNNWF